MQSPFKIFRKHQKVVLAGLTLMAMIGFGLGDTLMKIGTKGAGSQAGKNVVDTSIGGLSQLEMQTLVFHRREIHRFIGSAYQKSHPDLAKSPFFGQFIQMIVRQFGFGGTSQPELLYSWLHRHEAQKMGIVVSDPQVRDYIDRFTERKLSTEAFKAILDEIHLSPRQLFDLFRDELQADIAQRMKLPAALPSPEKYWEYYQQLNTRQKIVVAALPVKDFTDKVAEPADAQIAALFEKKKADFDAAYDGEYKPGFRQPHKVKLHYLFLSYAEVKEKVLAGPAVTPEEIETYYERNKDTDLSLQERDLSSRDESEPINPDFAPEKGPKLDGDKTEPEDETPDEPGDKPKKPDADAKKPESSEKPDKKDEANKEEKCLPTAEDNDDEKPSEKSTDKNEADKKDADKPTGKNDADNKDAEKSDTGKKEAKKDAPADKEAPEKPEGEEETPAVTKPKESTDGAKKEPESPKIKYKPLTDELREVIRESIIRERTLKLMKEKTAEARTALSDLGIRFSTPGEEIKLSDPNPQQLKELEKRSEEELRKIADKLGMKFGKTDLVAANELSELPGIGKAMESGTRDAMRGGAASIVDQAFSGDRLCQAFESETLESNVYVSWKIEDAPVHIPKLSDPGIREQVVKAIRRTEALPLAKKRADELAERARKAKKDFATALDGETVTGDPRSLTVTTEESPEFSFYRDSSAPNMFRRNQGPAVELGNPIVVTSAGRKFMHVVFDELAPGDIGVALNDDATVYYIVKVAYRREADREAFKDAALFGFSSPYTHLAQIELQQAMAEYNSRLGEKYSVKWNDVAAREMGPMGSDDE